MTGENQDLTSCLLLSVFPPAEPSPLQAPLPGSGVAVFNSTLVQPACAGWEGLGWGAGSSFSPPPHVQTQPLKNNEVQVAPREPRPSLATGPTPCPGAANDNQRLEGETPLC